MNIAQFYAQHSRKLEQAENFTVGQTLAYGVEF